MQIFLFDDFSEPPFPTTNRKIYSEDQNLQKKSAPIKLRNLKKHDLNTKLKKEKRGVYLYFSETFWCKNKGQQICICTKNFRFFTTRISIFYNKNFPFGTTKHFDFTTKIFHFLQQNISIFYNENFPFFTTKIFHFLQQKISIFTTKIFHFLHHKFYCSYTTVFTIFLFFHQTLIFCFEFSILHRDF